MKSPKTPENELIRLHNLRSLEILDTPAEERFDRLTRMAKRVFGVSIALVSLVDENRQWFKSKIGLEATETTRNISFCGHAILEDDIFIIEDTLKDERFSDNPLVCGAPNIRFYAGVPLNYCDGSKLGTLCIIDQSPRTMNDEDRTLLRDLADMAEAELNALQLATLDDLTGLSNRRGFLALAANSMSLCIRQETSVSLVFFDLDHFKTVNDQFGHTEGDYALAAFADLMRQSFRESDVIARVGGDEFIVLLTNTEKDIAVETVARFRDLVEVYNEETQRGYDLVFSEGIASGSAEQKRSLEHLMNEADELMYRQKKRSQSAAPLIQKLDLPNQVHAANS